MEALDLFSAAAGGWSLGMHRAGIRTIAACEVVPWRRALHAENNPGVTIYHDVRSLTADQLVRDLGRLPGIVVGSPPCQDISTANTKGKGVDGERSRLFFEAVRLVGECRPRWFALENSANLRTRGADRVLGALEDLGYTAWPFVVRACDVGANHERSRCWIVGCDPEQLAADPRGWELGQQPGWRRGQDGTGSAAARIDAAPGDDGDADEIGRGSRRQASETQGAEPLSASRGAGDGGSHHGGHLRLAADAAEVGCSRIDGVGARRREAEGERARPAAGCRTGGDADSDGQSDGALHAEVGQRPRADAHAHGSWAFWNGGLADHLRVDDGLSARLADTRVVLGPRSRKSAANLLVEAFGDAVLPQIPEAIGRAILRTERAFAHVRAA